MKNPHPEQPRNLDPLAQAILDSLAGNSAVSCVILGGGIALAHYREFRPTHAARHAISLIFTK